ncbi:MAG TPA: sigma-70 family RNA polymerase sigma factor [Polyangiaceae bacterium]|nr:sigma-70 family RNA polymerase sigma factor [Polyangiaceae bacterium]
MPARLPDSPKLRLVVGQASARRPPTASQWDDVTDAELVAQVAAGEPHAFEALYRRHAPSAMSLAVRIQGSSMDVEDVVHDAFVRAHTRLGELKDAAAFRAWLGSIVVRLVRTRLRKRRLLGLLGLSTATPVDLDSIASPDADTESRVLLAQVYALLQTLAPVDRIAWTLRYIERHRLEAVAELMGCSLATAKRRILRAQRFISAHFVTPFSKDDP